MVLQFIKSVQNEKAVLNHYLPGYSVQNERSYIKRCMKPQKVERSTKEQPNTACTRRVGVCAFSGSLRGLKLVPSKRRSLVPPTRGNAHR